MAASAYFSFLFAAYLAAFIIYFVHFETRSDISLQLGRKAILGGLALHLLALAAPFFQCKMIVQAIHPEFAIPFFMLLAALLIEIKNRASFLMLFTLPIALVFLVAALGHDSQTQKMLAERGFWLWFHLAFVFIGMAVLAVAVSSAAMFLIQRRQITSHRPGKFFMGLPSLDTLERIHTRALIAGVVFFSVGLLSGLFWAGNTNSLGLFGKDPKVILSIAACALYWGMLGLRLSSFGRGRKIALGTLGAFVLLFLAAVYPHGL